MRSDDIECLPATLVCKDGLNTILIFSPAGGFTVAAYQVTNSTALLIPSIEFGSFMRTTVHNCSMDLPELRHCTAHCSSDNIGQ